MNSAWFENLFKSPSNSEFSSSLATGFYLKYNKMWKVNRNEAKLDEERKFKKKYTQSHLGGYLSIPSLPPYPMLGKKRKRDRNTFHEWEKLNNKRCPFRTGDINSSIFINQVRVVFQSGQRRFCREFRRLKRFEMRRRRRRQCERSEKSEEKCISMNSQHNGDMTRRWSAIEELYIPPTSLSDTFVTPNME